MRAKVELGSQTASLVIRVGADGVIQMDDQPMSLEALSKQLGDRADQPELVEIVGHRDCPFEKIAEVISVCQEQGIENYRVAPTAEQNEDRGEAETK